MSQFKTKEEREQIAEWKKFWCEYPLEPKPTRHLFYNRMLKLNKPKEYCIQRHLPVDTQGRRNTISVALKKKKLMLTNHKIEKDRRYNPDDYGIDITYPNIEERVNILQGYTRYIGQLEQMIDNSDDNDEIRELTKKVDTLKREKQQFSILNPII